MDDTTSTLTASPTPSLNEKSIAKETGESTREATRSPSPVPAPALEDIHAHPDHELGLKKTMSAVEAQVEMSKIMTSGEGVEYPTGIKLHLISLALCLSVFLMALDNTIIATAIPKITDQFHSLPDVG